MMNDKVSVFLQDLNHTFALYDRFSFYTRGIEFQRYCIKKIEGSLNKSIALKEEMIRVQDEESANIMLSLEYFHEALINELKMVVLLKQDEMNKAWGSLVDAQYFLRGSLQANDIVLKFNADNYMNKLILIERIFFPSQTFMSTGIIVDSSKCSICDHEYGKCDHVVGRPYMGKICHRQIAKIRKMTEVSLIFGEPGNKHCRVERLTDGGHWRDFLTWRIIKDNQTQKPTA